MHSGSNTIWFATGGFNASGDAIALVAIDQPLPDACIKRIASLENVTQAKQLRF